MPGPAQPAPALSLTGRIEHVTYHNGGNHFTIARFFTDENRSRITIKGTMPDPKVGQSIEIGGQWETHARYGQQFRFTTFRVRLPATVDGIRSYLASGVIKGVGPKLVDRIMQTAEEEAAAVLENARSSIDRRKTALKQRTDSIRGAATEQVKRQTSTLISAADAAIESARNRFRLSTEKRLYQLVEERAVAAIAVLRGSEEYLQIMRGWVSESVRSVGTADVVVVCPSEDRQIVEKVVRQMNAEPSGRDGRALTISLDETIAPAGQGVIARDRSGRIAFSNLVADRIRRYGPTLHTMIYHAVIEGGHDQ